MIPIASSVAEHENETVSQSLEGVAAIGLISQEQFTELSTLSVKASSCAEALAQLREQVCGHKEGSQRELVVIVAENELMRTTTHIKCSLK